MLNMSYSLRSPKEKLESQIAYTKSNLRYLLGAKPQDKRHIKWTQDKLAELEGILASGVFDAPQSYNVYYHEHELKK